MAPSSKQPAGGNQANHPASNPALSNGVEANNPGPAAVNRKKQKRRQKQAARQAAASEKQTSSGYEPNDFDEADLPAPHAYDNPPNPLSGAHNTYPDAYFTSSEQYEGADGDIAYSDEEGQYAYDPRFPTSNGVPSDYPVDARGKTGRSKKKKKNRSSQSDMVYDSTSYNPPGHYNPSDYAYPAASYPPQASPPRSVKPPPPISDEALRTVQRGIPKDPIWDTSSHEEKLKIKDFWLTLNESERKSLVKIEKEAVLRKMKEQQKHSCSCTVCGRKRTAIEEELETLYDAYYRELEQYVNFLEANCGLDFRESGLMLRKRSSRENSRRPIEATPTVPSSGVAPARHYHKPSNSRIRELPDDEEGEEDEEDELGEEDFSDGDYDDDEYSGDELGMHDSAAGDFLAFGNSLTVQGGILTVAEELLKNDGQKFIDMMEQLAERRLRREEDAHRAPVAARQAGISPEHYASHTSMPPEDEEYDEEDDDEFESQGEYDEEEEDEMDAMTESQRMDEGRRMFQIFAARMFEQRVLTAYREKVARERQNKLIEELEAEQGAATQRDAKKAREAEKKKAKKQQARQAKAEEKAKKDQQRAAEEAAARELEAKKQEEQKQKREEARKKRDAERKALEEEKQRKEAEKQRRQQEERERQQEAERKAREAKAEEKKRREEAKRKEREEREAKEQALREKKAQDEKARKEREEKAHAEHLAQERKRQEEESTKARQISPAPDTKKAPSLPPTMVALPPSFKSQKSSGSQPSPSKSATTPAVPKAPTPVRPRDTSGQTSQSSAPETPEAGPGPKQPTPPKMPPTQPNLNQSSVGLGRLPGRQQTRAQAPPVSPMHPVAPPPGMPHSQSLPYSNLPPGMMNGYPRGPGQMAPGLHQGLPPGRHIPGFNHVPPMGFPGQPIPNLPHNAQTHNAQTHNVQASGINTPGMFSRGFAPDSAASGFQHPSAPVHAHGMPPQTPAQGMRKPHSRQPSSSFESPQAESQAGGIPTQPIARPQPIKRPLSAKEVEGAHNKPTPVNTDVDTITRGLGSSALLDDSDEPLPGPENRRPSGAPAMPPPNPFSPPFEQHPAHMGNIPGRGAPSSNWGPPTPFGQSAFPSNPGWGNSAAGWSNHLDRFRGNNPRSSNPRPITVRLLVTQACHRLSAMKGNVQDTFHEMSDILKQIESFIPPTERMVSVDEFFEILDTEGDSHNGGGSFFMKRPQPNSYLIKWEPDNAGPSAARGSAPAGQIGGAVPGSSMIGRGF